jgi:copper chaperone CopZ
MLLYQTNFTVTGLENSEKVNKLKTALLRLNGVSKVEINRPKMVTITYNPTKIVPSVLSSIMSSLGFKTPGG